MEDFKKDFLILQYQYLAEEMRFSKKRQLVGTTYIFALYAVIANTHKSWFVFKETWWLPVAFSLILLFAGFSFICYCKNSQKNSSCRLKLIVKEFQLPVEMTTKEYAIPCYRISIDSLYYILHASAWLVTIFLIVN